MAKTIEVNGEQLTKTKILNRIVKSVCAMDKGKKQLDAPMVRRIMKALIPNIKNNPELTSLVNAYIKAS